MKQRLLIALIAIDHLVLVLLTLGNCHRGETISAAAWTLEQDLKFMGFMRPVIDWLFTWVERDHCFKSWTVEKHFYPKESHD